MSAGGKAAIILGALVLVAALAVCAYGFMLMGGSAIFPNVYIAGIDVGGLEREAALAAVQDEVTGRFTADTLTIQLPDQTVTIDSDASNIALDADEAVDAAMTYGRNGGPLRAILTYRRAQTGRYDVNLTSSLALDTEYIRSTLEQAARKAEKTLVEPQVTFDEQTKTITVVTGSPKVSLDVDKLYDAVLARYDAGNFSELTFDYDTVPCESVDLKPYYDKYCTEMTDAYYDEEKHELVPEVKGFGFDLEYYTQQIAMADAGKTFTIQMKDLVPEVTLESLEKEYFSTTLAKYDSPHVVNADRTKNLELACAAINGTILNPGEIFSFNKVVGERTPEKGYRPATIYQAGGKREKCIYSEMGEMLMTHFGVSGPLVLTLSGLLPRDLSNVRLSIDLKPALDAQTLDARLVRDFRELSRKQLSAVMDGLVPHNLGQQLLVLAKISGAAPVHSVTAEQRHALVELLKNVPLTPKRLRGFDEAIVTRGGVSVKDVNPSTMESKRLPGLYFAGELLDVDATTGGFNLQIAFSTGALAGQSAASKEEE